MVALAVVADGYAMGKGDGHWRVEKPFLLLIKLSFFIFPGKHLTNP
jgi:hypothetical protein